MTCQHCGDPLPATARRDARYCTVRCRVAAFRSKVAPESTPNEIGRPGALQPLHCPACSRKVGRSDGVTVILEGQWTVTDDVFRWSAWAEERTVRVTLPATIRCQHCRAEVRA